MNICFDKFLSCTYPFAVYLLNRLEFVKNETEYWMNKYEKDIESLDLEVQINTESISEYKEKIQKLKLSFDQRKNNIDKYKEYDTQKQKMIRKHKRLNNAAIAIQVIKLNKISHLLV